MGLNTVPIKVETKLPNFQLRKKLVKQRFSEIMTEAEQEVASMAKDQLAASVKLKIKNVSNSFLQSIYSRILPAKSREVFGLNVGFTRPASEYAFFANYGRAAGKNPPFEPIKRWASSRGIDEDLVVWKIVHNIGEEGTKGNFFMEHAEPIIQRKARAILERKTNEFTRTL